jgi:hypothetical protein
MRWNRSTRQQHQRIHHVTEGAPTSDVNTNDDDGSWSSLEPAQRPQLDELIDVQSPAHLAGLRRGSCRSVMLESGWWRASPIR